MSAFPTTGAARTSSAAATRTGPDSRLCRPGHGPKTRSFHEAPTAPCTRRPPRSALAQLPGAGLRAFEILKPLGIGGMGTVFLAARGTGDDRELVALKVMNPGGSMERFANEARVLERLGHPSVVRYFGSGHTSDGRPFLAMEYVAGSALDLFCDAHRLSIDRRLEIFHQVCRGVQYVHERRVVHRDLKPANILVGKGGKAKLLDFGIAKPLARAAYPPSDETAWIQMMTPAYASPEQVRRTGTTPASDIYSLGALLYKLLTGRPPHPSLDFRLYQLEHFLTEDPPLRPSDAVLQLAAVGRGSHAQPGELLEVCSRRSTDPRRLRRRLTGDLDSIVSKALREDPAERYGSAAELADDVWRHLGGLPAEARRGTIGYRMARFMSRSRQALGAAPRSMRRLAATP